MQAKRPKRTGHKTSGRKHKCLSSGIGVASANAGDRWCLILKSQILKERRRRLPGEPGDGPIACSVDEPKAEDKVASM